ncbi:hypothetical protein E3P94_03386 [Wallemia ichthyophaga]|uniref:Carboxylic ester hydrolase n=1 Tax=Wallemia ichthyophaga TaxID=245174 RepID=A0A4T0G4C5_WALIC|nr:hypothetical protein E3P91_01453 [Wallemia ichthyophaga]TIA96178.1 hypothetical protein E3P95_03378 [Wallemia ichthyophaga]TIA97227.1 hypothetical protein E3P94_03386 [Wallemia ichthyophaga]TIB29852.1 hypothetical protein E3P86_03604 [Wallemia ichthyophaga]TIB63919.1 hypothetical protein E3P78_01514 [Wallemia ichthyophaga]
MKLIGLFAALLVAARASPTSNTSQPSVTLPQGVVVGTSSSDDSVHKYLGIPYAQQTARFEKAAPIQSQSQQTQIDATHWKNKCIQTDTGLAAMPDNDMEDGEDCLYANVYAPSNAQSQGGKAVLVWIYGGGLQTGNAGKADLDGTSFAANQDVILVSFNYRLNVFGFSNAPTLDRADVNVGFYDQRLALEWIHAHIASFGGDPERITLMGESSGAAAVDRLVLNPPSVPIRAAIMQSGQATLSPAAHNNGAEKWAQVAASVGCANDADQAAEYSCMQNKDVTALKQAVQQLGLSFYPVNDDITQSATPLQDAVKGGMGAQIPLIIGTNEKEGSLYVGPYIQSSIDGDGNINTTMLAETINSFGILPDTLSGLVKPYLDSLLLVSPETLFNTLSDLVTAVVFKCPAMETAHAHIYPSDAPVYRYQFSGTFPDTRKSLPQIGIEDIGAYHTSEITLVFGTYEVASSTENEKALSAVMQSYWASFAKDPYNMSQWNTINHLHINDMACFGCEGHEAGVKTISELEIDGDCLVLDSLLTANMPLF